VYTGDVANIGIDPDALARPFALWYQHSTIIEGVNLVERREYVGKQIIIFPTF
jgi:hypothetical protein